MPSQNIYQVGIPTNDLPPKDIRVFPIDSSGTTVIDIVTAYGAIAFDTEVNNTDAATATVVMNDQIGYTLDGGNIKSHTDVLVQSITITGITTGFVILHTIDLATIRSISKGALVTK